MNYLRIQAFIPFQESGNELELPLAVKNEMSSGSFRMKGDSNGYV